jgi:uncharacterized delta-60 repeat protein
MVMTSRPCAWLALLVASACVGRGGFLSPGQNQDQDQDQNQMLTLSRVAPPAGPQGQSTLITLSGDGFVPSMVVAIGATICGNVQWVSAQELSCTLPSCSLGTVDVTAVDPGGRSARLAASFICYQPNSFDPSFGGTGKVTTDVAGGDDRSWERSVLIQSSGKIVLAGQITVSGKLMMGLIRYQIDGSLDPTFGNGGVATAEPPGALQSVVADAVLQRDDSIVVSGNFSDPVVGRSTVVARFSRDGALDPMFATGGMWTTRLASVPATSSSEYACGIAMDALDRPVVVGFAITASGPADMHLFRFLTNGSLDSGFGTGGHVVADFGGDDTAWDVTGLPDGGVAVAVTTLPGPGTAKVVKYTAAGVLDSGFGAAGIASLPYGDPYVGINRIAASPDGKILAAGSTTYSGFTNNVAVWRLTPGGQLDPAFGTGGMAITDYQSRNDVAYGTAVSADGRIVVVGNTRPGDVSPSDFLVIGYLADGTVDPTFGVGGFLAVDFFGGFNCAYGVAFDAVGRVVVAGHAYNGGTNQEFALLRYWP